ncbi:hypothetical protein LEMLEM_LOCUS10183 [Lemmus lemmus]
MPTTSCPHHHVFLIMMDHVSSNHGGEDTFLPTWSVVLSCTSSSSLKRSLLHNHG